MELREFLGAARNGSPCLDGFITVYSVKYFVKGTWSKAIPRQGWKGAAKGQGNTEMHFNSLLTFFTCRDRCFFACWAHVSHTVRLLKQTILRTLKTLIRFLWHSFVCVSACVCVCVCDGGSLVQYESQKSRKFFFK